LRLSCSRRSARRFSYTHGPSSNKRARRSRRAPSDFKLLAPAAVRASRQGTLPPKRQDISGALLIEGPFSHHKVRFASFLLLKRCWRHERKHACGYALPFKGRKVP
jgi:hypothetical protein